MREKVQQRIANRLFYWSLSHVKPRSSSAEYGAMGIRRVDDYRKVVTDTCAVLYRATSYVPSPYPACWFPHGRP